VLRDDGLWLKLAKPPADVATGGLDIDDELEPSPERPAPIQVRGCFFKQASFPPRMPLPCSVVDVPFNLGFVRGRSGLQEGVHVGEWRGAAKKQWCSLARSRDGPLCTHGGSGPGVVPARHWSCCGQTNRAAACTAPPEAADAGPLRVNAWQKQEIANTHRAIFELRLLRLIIFGYFFPFSLYWLTKHNPS
jgi:hypothetical protein